MLITLKHKKNSWDVCENLFYGEKTLIYLFILLKVRKPIGFPLLNISINISVTI